MKKIIFSCAIMATLFVTALSVVGQEQAEAPTYKDGDFWRFKVAEKGMTIQTTAALDGNYGVSFSGGNVRVGPAGGGKVETRQDLGELRRMLGIDDERQYLQFPIVVGKKWSIKYQAATRVAAGGAQYRTAETTVTGVEDVTTPAGTFRAFKIERYDTGGGAGPKGKGRTTWTYTYYYSPQTRSVVKYFMETDSEGTAGGYQRD